MNAMFIIQKLRKKVMIDKKLIPQKESYSNTANIMVTIQ